MPSLLKGIIFASTSVNGKPCFQNTLVLVLWRGIIQAEHVCVNGVY
jgi:hypothetical protein